MTNQESNCSPATATSARGSQRFSGDGLAGRQLGRLAWLPHAVATVASLLKEIFDESAYGRFLERNRIPSSQKAYAAFREENDRLKAQRPKCC
jgi:hypothetical protein